MKYMLSKSILFVFGVLLILSSCEYDYYVIPAPVPAVSSSNPADGDTGVSLNKTITVVFDQEMAASSVGRSTFYVTSGGAEISGALSVDGSTISFVPTSLFLPSTSYTCNVTTGLKNKYGVSLSDNFVFTFKTGADTTSAPPDTTIVTGDTISFSQDIVPFFASNCVACHKGSTPPDLRTNMAYNSLMNGNYVVAKDPDNSELYKALKPGGSMKAYCNASQLALVKRWILAGAKND